MTTVVGGLADATMIVSVRQMVSHGVSNLVATLTHDDANRVSPSAHEPNSTSFIVARMVSMIVSVPKVTICLVDAKQLVSLRNADISKIPMPLII